jgi:hypothetical protein
MIDGLQNDDFVLHSNSYVKLFKHLRQIIGKRIRNIKTNHSPLRLNPTIEGHGCLTTIH